MSLLFAKKTAKTLASAAVSSEAGSGRSRITAGMPADPGCYHRHNGAEDMPLRVIRKLICAARIEKLTGQLGRAILASGEFARHCAGEFTPLGEFRLAGFSSPQLVFALAVE
jgi:hypothetical protein